MKKYFPVVLLVAVVCMSFKKKDNDKVSRPKLVVGVVVDQMRWDYLYRFYDRYGNGGFKRLLNKGYSCENTMVNYLPSYTAPGHSCIYTGSVPSIHGIAGNEWIDNETGRVWYCAEDTTVWLAGDEKKKPAMSPRNLLATTITDELKLATNFRSRVYGVALKDRGSILPAGHAANAAYWYDEKSGNFVTSTFYKEQYHNPKWLQQFNARKLADSLVLAGWPLLYDAATYTQSTIDDATNYEEVLAGEKAPIFPHKFDQLNEAVRLKMIKGIPAGNTYTLMMAEACIAGAEGGPLGRGNETDFLCVSLSSTDYVGHRFAPNSVELEDCYLRLDMELAKFMEYLDEAVGKDNYLFFLSADHAGAHNPEFLKDNNLPGGLWPNVTKELNAHLRDVFKKDGPFVANVTNYQVFLKKAAIAADASLSRDKIKDAIYHWMLHTMPKKFNVPVSYVMDMENMNKTAVPEPIRTMAVNGYHRNRSGCLQVVLAPGWFETDGPEPHRGTTHGSWNPYDTHIPLLWYGWNIPQGHTNTVVNMTDISATLAAMLHIQMPSGCVGKPITELLNR